MRNAMIEQPTPPAEERRRWLRSILAAILPPLVAFIVQALFWSTISPFAWFLFYPAVFMSSWLGGPSSGVGATVMSTAVVLWYFVPPERSLAVEERYLLSATVFMTMGFVFSAFHGRLRRATRHAAAALAASQRANESLEKAIQQRRIFGALIENSSDFIGIADAAGKPIYVNPGGRRMVGLAADYPVENTQIPEYYPPDQRSFVLDAIAKSVTDQGHWQGETYFRHWQTEKAIPVSDTHFVIREPESGQVLGIGTVTRDISDIKRARDEADAANRKLQELDELKNQMFASVSHELRTPLTLILGPTHQLLATQDLSETARATVQVIERNARTLLHHVNDLLEVSKLEAGKTAPEYAEVDLARLVRFVASLFEVLAAEKNIALTIEASDELWVDIDQEKFECVLLNLLSNAFKFTPAGGRVRVSLRHADDERALVEVADSGPGIPVEKREAAFERFRQLDEEGARRPFGGTGLGLTIAHEIVALHDGAISIADAPEGGALFAIEIPAKAPPAVPVRPRTAVAPRDVSRDEAVQVVEELRVHPAVAARETGAADGALVLVVEDNPDMNRFIVECLGTDHEVATAFDGKEGLAKALERKPDVILTDIMMPKMSGDELVRAVRSRPELDATSVVLLSAKADDELRVQLLREGAQDYLTKPFSAEELRARVENLIAKKRAEELVQQAEAKFRGIVAIAADAIISVDEGQRIVLYNDGAEKIFGWSRDEVIGKRLDILLPERSRKLHDDHLRKFAAGDIDARRMGEGLPAVFGLRKSGEEFPAHAAISKLRVGNAWIFTVMLQDITEHERIEREQKFLAEVGAVLASTLDDEETPRNLANLVVGALADVCVVEIVEEGWQARRVVAHRDPGRAALADALQRVPIHRRRPHLCSSVLETTQPLLMSEVTREYLESISQSDEHRRVLRDLDPKSFVALPLLAHGRLLGALILVSTTATHRYAPADLPFAAEVAHRAALAVESARLYRAARRATDTRDEVLGVVAHDLRNPLGVILMQAELLRHDAAEPEGQSRKPAEVIERAATRMNRLIQDLLDVTRMEGGHLPVEQACVSAGHVVADSVEAQRPLASLASLELRLEAAEDLPDVRGDGDRLIQVFENLIGNAIKFTAPGGRIMVGARPGDGEILFWVADTGRGIAAEDLPHVFDRFWQARKGGRSGAGLGLPIVKGIVEAHGGRIWVESTPGHGSTFFFTIPMELRRYEISGDACDRAN